MAIQDVSSRGLHLKMEYHWGKHGGEKRGTGASVWERAGGGGARMQHRVYM